MIEYDEVITVKYIASTKKQTNTIATNVTSTASVNCHNIKIKVCYILHTVLLAIMLLLITNIIWYHYAKKYKNGK